MDLFEPMDRVRVGPRPDRRRRRRPRGVIRRAAARRERDELEVADAELGFAIGLRRRCRRAVTGVATALRPRSSSRSCSTTARRSSCSSRTSGRRSTSCRWRWPTRRSRSGRRRCASTGPSCASMPLLDDHLRGAGRRSIEPPPISARPPASVELMRRRPTPPGDVLEGHLRVAPAVAVRGRRCASPSELAAGRHLRPRARRRDRVGRRGRRNARDPPRSGPPGASRDAGRGAREGNEKLVTVEISA